MDPALAADWMRRWRLNILGHTERPCDTEMGEQIGWRVAPFLSGFFHGYLATGEREWVDRLLDWADAVIRRGVKEPDGYIGWPRAEDADVLDYLPPGEKERYTDNELGEAMFLRPLALMAGEILGTPALKKEYGAKAEEYLRLSERMFEKWESRGAWREVKPYGGIWVVPQFGLDPQTGQWVGDYERRHADGNSLPANKETLIALWLLAMHDVTRKPIYRDRAEKWWRLLRSRMRLRENGRYFVWNYWDPGVPWDTNPDGSLKHWVGVHPNGGYYDIDVRGIVAAHEHGLVFGREEILRLIATNRDFMWNKQVQRARFQRIDGGPPDPRWPDTPGVLWSALAPYDRTLRQIFEANHDPAGWGGLSRTPEWLVRFGPKPASGR
jgi:hypothetical protein